jgi:MoaA/NifB/PqqE/SkfB family radical SAM enzyme
VYPEGLAILYTYKCNFLCEHCSINSSPIENEVLEFKYIEKIINEAYYIPSIKLISFTGGEPTLFPSILKKGISLANVKGFDTRLVTNAWWARTYEYSLKFLKELKDLGLREINISFDIFHKKYLDKLGGERNIVNAVRASLDLGLKVAIAVAKINSSYIDSNYLRNILGELYGKVELIIEGFISWTGRARVKINRTQIGRSSSSISNTTGCKYIGTTLALHPDGRITVCCGHVINVKEANWIVTIGNIKTESLYKLIEKMRVNPFLWYIHLKGPHTLVWKFNSNEDIKHICEGCYLLATKYIENLKVLISKKQEFMNKILRGEDIEWPIY